MDNITLDDITLEDIEVINKGYHKYCEKHDITISLGEYLQKRLLNTNGMSKLLENSELQWINNYFDEDDLKIIKSKYYEKQHYFREGAKATVDNKFKISILKNSAAETFVQNQFDLIDLRAQPFKVIFSNNTKLDRPEWELISHRRTWCEHNKPYLNKKYGVIVTTEDGMPKIAAILDRKVFNKHALFSRFSEHIIIHKQHYQKAVLEFDQVLKEFNANIIYQTHIDQKTLTAINRLKKAHFSELKNTQEMFELIIDCYYSKFTTQFIKKEIATTAKHYSPDSKKRLLNYSRTTKNMIREMHEKDSNFQPEIIARAAFNNPESLLNWYRKEI